MSKQPSKNFITYTINGSKTTESIINAPKDIQRLYQYLDFRGYNIAKVRNTISRFGLTEGSCMKGYHFGLVSLYKENENLRVVSFDNSGKILEVSSRKPNNENTLFAYFKLDDIKDFMTGEARTTEHIVRKTSDVFTYEIIKTKVSIKKRITESQLFHIEEQDNAELDITFDGEYLVFTPSKKLKESSDVDPSQSVMVAGKSSHVFFITYEGKPEHLIQTIHIPFSELLSTGFSIKFDYNKYSISLYTQKFLETYSFRRL